MEPIHTLERGLHSIFTVDFYDYLRKWVPLSILIGIVGGSMAILFQILLDLIWNLCYGGSVPGYMLFLIPAVGGLIVGLIAKLAPETSGSGTDRVIDALHRRGGKLEGARFAPLHVLTSAVTIGTGGSAGQESPMSFVGAGMASIIGRVMKLTREERRVFVISGMAACFSALFKAPLGAAIFAMEIPYKNDLESNAIIPSLISSVTSYLVFIPIYGTDPIFFMGSVSYGITTDNFMYVLLVGVLVGLFGIVFIRLFYLYHTRFKELGVPLWAKIALGGLMTGIIGMAVPEVLGLGEGTIQNMIDGVFTSYTVILALLAAKMMATIFTTTSGGSGGVFLPSLFLGGLIGGMVASMFSLPEYPLYVVIGMGAMFACTTKSPVSAPVMTTEMVGGFGVIIPLIVASVISYIITGRNTIYSKQITRKAFAMEPSLLGDVRVRDIMIGDLVTLEARQDITMAYRTSVMFPHYIYPVLQDGLLVGIAPMKKLEAAHHMRPGTEVRDVMHDHYETIDPNEDALEAFERMNDHQISRLFVIEDGAPVGILTRLDVLRALERMDSSHHRY